ncbi:hypothetical protein [Streptomyces sp. NPDC048172]|uniref:hypothetical protein n=1 Tax=Streptomyces sp. NPDC048172 TaxID=3365505 RepID=UPI00371625AD
MRLWAGRLLFSLLYGTTAAVVWSLVRGEWGADSVVYGVTLAVAGAALQPVLGRWQRRIREVDEENLRRARGE